jgi:hypothetical protein
MQDRKIDGVDYLTELTRQVGEHRIVSRPLSCPGTSNATTMMPSSARPGI